MSAPIVYEGQLQGQGGTLFKDIKFWVAHRVPMRGTWIQNIENNGGSLVKLDKQADFLIADHARKDSPAGSYSWKWIEESVKSGQLLDKSAYLINTPSRESRPVGSVQQKSTRNPFTKEDDQILVRFVTKKERSGNYTLGNVIYQELEAQYPHHTYQSWRDRWVKKVQYLPRPQVSNAEASPVTTPEVPAATRPPSVRRATVATPVSPRSSRAPLADADSPRKKTRAKFTEEEDKVLLELVADLKAHGKSVKGQIAYQQFAEEFPQHSWQAWRDRYVKTLLPRELVEDEQESKLSVSRIARAAAVKKAARDLANVNAPRVQRRPTSRIEVEADVRQEDLKSEPPEDIDEPQQRDVQFDRNGVADEPEDALENELDNEPDNEPENEPENEMEDELEVDPSPNQAQQPHGSPTNSEKSSAVNQEDVSPVPETKQGLPKSALDRAEFYDLLEIYTDPETASSGKHIYWSTIQGKSIDLWDLWTEVQAQKVAPVERDWQQIAENMGYNWVDLPSVPDDVRECYESRLEFLSQYLDAADEGEDDSEDELADRLDGQAGPGNQLEMMEKGQESAKPAQLPPPSLQPVPALESDNQFNSSPPKQPSLKRSRDSAISSDLAYPESARKRPRLGRDDEIPSTPDAKNGTSHLRHPASAGVSPSDRLRRMPQKSPASALRDRKARQADVEDERVQEHIRESFSPSRSQNATVEPETQYFSFESQVMDDFDEESQEDALATPSQQLRSEIDAEERRQQLNRTSPSVKRKAKSPFLPDDAESAVGTSSLSDRSRKAVNSSAPWPESLQEMPRSSSAPLAKRAKDLTSSRKKMQAPSRVASTQSASPSLQHRSPKPTPPLPKPRSKAEELDEVVEYWMSLGYSHDHARRSLEAATWEPALAGRIMQQLKNGDTIPTNWEGVWTARDDDALRLVDSPAGPRDEKEARKRRKAVEKLRNKHGEERMELRRRWLVVKAGL